MQCTVLQVKGNHKVYDEMCWDGVAGPHPENKVPEPEGTSLWTPQATSKKRKDELSLLHAQVGGGAGGGEKAGVAAMGVMSLDISPRTVHAAKGPLGPEPHTRKENKIPRLSMGPPSPGVALADAGQREQKSIVLELMFLAIIVVLKDRRLHWRAPQTPRRPLQHLLLLPPPLMDWYMWTHTMEEAFTFRMGYL
jgi:hypothetical protein